MDSILNWLNQFDWKTIGAAALVVVTNISLIITWLNRNINNLDKLRSDSALTNNSINYSKATIKSNKDTLAELNKLNKEVRTLGVTINNLYKVVDKLMKENIDNDL